jgi:hypothetical protein
MVRVGEALKHQGQLIQARIEQIDQRFEQGSYSPRVSCVGLPASRPDFLRSYDNIFGATIN